MDTVDADGVNTGQGTHEMYSRPPSTFDGIEWPDYVVIGIYFLSVLAVGIYVSFKVLQSNILLGISKQL